MVYIFLSGHFLRAAIIGGALLSGGPLLSGFNSKVKNKRYFRVAVVFGGPVIIGILRYVFINLISTFLLSSFFFKCQCRSYLIKLF